MLILQNANGLEPEITFNCGQCFRWLPAPGGWQGVVSGCSVLLRQEGSSLILEGAEEKDRLFWEHYFALDMDYPALQARFCAGSRRLKLCVEENPGIRVLRQPFFETLCTFIISQNNNIPRIKQLCDRISERYGTKVGDTCAFPTAEQMRDITEQDYKDMKFGFRAKYLADAVAKVLDGAISEEKVKSLTYEEAQKYLMQIKGVGPKVADCVLLFSCRQYRSFPKDVWIKKAMAQLFPDGIPKEIEGYEGIAQQYIFHFARHNLKE